MSHLLPTKPTRTALKTTPTPYFNSWCFKSVGCSVFYEVYVNNSLTQTEHYVRDASGSVLSIYRNGEQTELPIYGASRLGVFYKKSNSSVYQLTDHLGNVRAVVAKQGNNAAALVAKTDYYPFGMPMPNRNIEGNYRYGYQGEFAEKEPELGNGQNSFQLRLYDSRIGRWITTDPMHQYYSPYMAMDNRPNMSVDPTGGCTVGVDCPEEFNWMEKGTTVLDEVVIGGGDFSTGIAWETDAISAGGIFDFSMRSESFWQGLYAGIPDNVNEIFSPTSQGIRNDSGGLGHFGAPRGKRLHTGVDFKTNAGQDIVSLLHGKAQNLMGATTKKPLVQFIPNPNSFGITKIEILYVDRLHNVQNGKWYEVKGVATILGTAADLSNWYPENVTDHVHTKFFNSSGILVNPQTFFKN